jgi:hypothetical protein
MTFHTRSGVPALALGLLIVMAVAACGGAAAAPGANGGGNGSEEQIPGDNSATLKAAFDSVMAAESFQFEATTQEYGTFPAKATASGTVRSAPVAASLFTWTAVDGTASSHLIHDGTLWIDGGDGNFVNVGDVSDSIRDQQAAYEVRKIWDALSHQLDDYELVGEEQVGGVATTHYRLNDYRREQFIETMKMPVSQYSADIWVDADGYLRKVFRGVQPDAAGEPAKGSATTWILTAIDCECPVEPPAK